MEHRITIGVDVGGTNTDAILLDSGTGAIIAAQKRATTRDPTTGVIAAVNAVLSIQSGPSASGAEDNKVFNEFNKRNIVRCCVGTTHCVNAIVSRSEKDLAKVFAIRIGGEQTTCLPPFCMLPDDLRSVIDGGSSLIHGGHSIYNTEHCPLDEKAVRQAVRDAYARDVYNFAISSPFSVQTSDHEERAAAVVMEEADKILKEGKDANAVRPRITQSHVIGGPNLVKRENAAILNAALRPMAERMTQGLAERLRLECGLECPVFLTQNDGTVLSLERARDFPALTFGSGPTNSMRGAAFIARKQDTECVVVDIGGTTSDVGLLLRDGFPRLSNVDVHVGGCLVNSRIPAVTSAPIGGGSLVDLERFEVGPKSVGYELTNAKIGGRVFGGPALTATDIATKLGLCSIGAGASALADVSDTTARRIHDIIHDRIQACVDDAKTSASDVPLLLVGGGSILVAPTETFDGVASVEIPAFASVANAVGAALADASEEREMIFNFDETTRETAEEEITAIVKEALIAKGVQPGTIAVVSLTSIKVGFVSVPLYRVLCRAVGSFAESRITFNKDASRDVKVVQAKYKQLVDDSAPKDDVANVSATLQPVSIGPAETVLLPPDYKRQVKNGVWIVSEMDLECISVGAGILGCGGGGNTLFGLARAIQHLRSGKPIHIVDPDSLSDDAVVAPCGFLGTPSAAIEMLGTGLEAATAAAAVGKASGKQVTHLACIEIGGTNALEPLSAAADLGIPVVDGDAMGRAFPTVLQYLPWLLGQPVAPIALVPCWNSPSHIYYSKDKHEDGWCAGEFGGIDTMLEAAMALGREVTGGLAGVCGIGLPLLSSGNVRDMFALHTYTRAFNLGLRVLAARRDHEDPIAAVTSFEAGFGKVIFKGNTGSCTPHFEGTQWDCATCPIRGVDEFSGQIAEVGIQNEYICITEPSAGVLAAAPTLIAFLDRDTGRPIFSDEIKTGYGLRIAVTAMEVPQVWKDHPAALAQVGPEQFAFDKEGKPQKPA